MEALGDTMRRYLISHRIEHSVIDPDFIADFFGLVSLTDRLYNYAEGFLKSNGVLIGISADGHKRIEWLYRARYF